MAIEIVDFPIKSGDFPIAMLAYQRVGCKGTPYFHTKPVSHASDHQRDDMVVVGGSTLVG